MSTKFQDKVVIVTGASNGIGAATATLFAAQGARIAALDIRDPPSTEPNPNRLDIKCNVAVEEEVVAAVQQVIEKWGTIDVLCNVAGIADNLGRVTDVTAANMTRIFSINFNGPLYLMKHVIPHFLAKPGEPKPGPNGLPPFPPHKGTIINVCSVAATSGASAGALYTSSKHALLGLSRNTSWMYAKEGVRTNVVMPGGVLTNIMANSGWGPESFTSPGYKTVKPFHDLAPGYVWPDDVASAIVFIAGAEGMNGAEVTIDHGWTTA